VVALAHAVVRRLSVSEPDVGSVTPKACSRSFARAIAGSQRAFCAALPCRSSVPMVYIWAWQAAPLQPDGLDLLHDGAAAVMVSRCRRIVPGSAP
jgi:hypothetical protein